MFAPARSPYTTMIPSDACGQDNRTSDARHLLRKSKPMRTEHSARTGAPNVVANKPRWIEVCRI
jgi:hypothetical protein